MVIVETEIQANPEMTLTVERLDGGWYDVRVGNFFHYYHRTLLKTMYILGEYIGFSGQTERAIVVRKEGDRYDVSVDGVLRHPGCSGEGVLRALGNYLMVANFSISFDGVFASAT